MKSPISHLRGGDPRKKKKNPALLCCRGLSLVYCLSGKIYPISHFREDIRKVSLKNFEIFLIIFDFFF